MPAHIVISTPVSPVTAESLIQQLYVAYFNRPADPAGLAYWQNLFLHADATTQYNETARLFSTSAEYTAQYLGLSNAEVVDKVYLNLFGRHAEAGGLVYWSDLLDRHLINVSNVVTQVAAGAQLSDLTAIHDKTQGAVLFTRALNTPEKVAYYAGDSALALVKAFISSIVDDATFATQTTPDALQNMIDSLHLPPPPPVIPAVLVNLTSGIDLIAPATDRQLAGADTFNAYSSGSNEALNAGDSIDGGSGNDTLNIVSTTGNAWTTPGNVVLKNIENLSLRTDKAATMDTSGWSGITSLSVNASGSSNVNAVSATNISLTAVSGTGSAVVNGGNNVDVSVSGALFGSDGVSIGHTIEPGGVVNLSYTAKDTGGSGLLYVAGGTAVHVEQGHAHGANITALNAPVTIQGGALTTSVTVVNSPAATASASTPGVQTNRVSINDINSNSLNQSGHITSAIVSNYSSLSINDNALTSLNLSGGTGDISIVNGLLQNPVNKTLQLTLNGVLRGTLDDGDVYATINITTEGADSTLSAITDTALTALTVSGSKHLTLASGTGAPNLGSVVVSGAAGLSANLSGIALNSVDTSASTGSNTITIDGSRVNYIGGSGADIVTLVSSSAGHTVTVGSGADRVTLAAAPTSLNTYTSILDPHAGLTVAFADLGTETFASTKLVLANGASFHDYADGIIAAAGNAASNGAIGWFQFGGDTFVVESRHNNSVTTGFVGGTDVIVRLVGNLDLTHASFASSEEITLA